MLLGLSLLYVGAVLILNGLWMLARISDREVKIINVFTGLLTLLVSLKLALGDGANAASIKAGAFSLLFSFTYLWVAYNRHTGADGRGLGWFSLFVALTAAPVSFDVLSSGAPSAGNLWLGLSWAAWALLWLLFFLLLALQKPLMRLTAWTSIGQGIATGWIPGFLILTGRLA
ncbi:MAG: transporter [Rhodocyclaceae bacterium]|nr:transporter [Rhodocyclaceae bacterium]MCP5234064.1 transporter [Zoogloeaceae bacterium]